MQWHYFNHHLKRELDELYISTVIFSFAGSMLGLFSSLYFYSLGFRASSILLFFALHYFAYALFIPFVAKIVAKIGYEMSIAVSMPFYGCFLIALIFIEKFPFLFYFTALIWAFYKSFYWLGFHSDFVRYSQARAIGEEVGFLRLIVGLANVAGPTVGGFILAKFGFFNLFTTVLVIAFVSLIPLLITKEPVYREEYSLKKIFGLFKERLYRRDILASLGSGEDVIAQAVWPIFLFLIVPSYKSVGILTSVVLLVTFVAVLAIGKRANLPAKERLIKSSATVVALSWLSKILAFDWFFVFVTDSFYRVSRSILEVPLQALIYIRPQKNRILEYVVFRETALAFGKSGAAFLCFLLFLLTNQLIYAFILAGALTFLYFFWKDKLNSDPPPQL